MPITYVRWMLNILRNHQTFLKWFYHVLLYPSKVGDIQFLYNFCQYLVYGQFYNLSDLIGVSCYLIAIWNWIFLITSDAEHPFCFLPSVHCHWLSVCSNNLPIFKQFFVISLLSCERSLPFLYKNHLSDICFARYQILICSLTWASPDGSVGKEFACNAGVTGDMGSTPGSGQFSGGGNGNPFQYSCLENSVDRVASQTVFQRVPKSWTWLGD